MAQAFQATGEQRQTEINMEIAVLERECANIQSLAEDAMARFGTVLNDPVPQPPAATQSNKLVAVDPMPQSPLGRDIRNIRCRAELTRELLADLLRRAAL